MSSPQQLPNFHVLLVDENGTSIGTVTNPLQTTGGAGGGGGTVTQGAGSGIVSDPWIVRISNGTDYIEPATETTLSNVDANLSDIQAILTNNTQKTQISNGTNEVDVLNSDPVGTEWGLCVRLVGSINISSTPSSSNTASDVPTIATYIAGVDSNNLLRGFTANADGDANPSTGKMVTLPAVVKNSEPTLTNNKLAPLWLETDGRLQTKTLISDGSNTGTIKTASTAPTATDTSLVVSISPNSADPTIGIPNTTLPSKGLSVGGVDSTGLLQIVSLGGDNNINPTTGKVFTLPARANANKQTFTEGRIIPLSSDLNGYVRTITKQEVAPTFFILSNATAPSLNKSMISIAVANAANKKVVIKNIRILNVQTPAIVGVNTEFQLLRFTGNHAAGVNLTPISYDTVDTLSSNITVKTNANISGEITNPLRQWFLNSDEILSGATTNQGLQTLSQFAPNFGTITIKQPTIRPGEGLHVKCITNTSTGSWGISVEFTEEDL